MLIVYACVPITDQNLDLKLDAFKRAECKKFMKIMPVVQKLRERGWKWVNHFCELGQ